MGATIPGKFTRSGVVGAEAWQEVHDRLATADRAALSADDLDLLAEAHFWLDQPAESVAARRDAYHAHLANGDVERAAMSAFHVFYEHFLIGETSVARSVVPGGTVGVQVWGTLEASIGYARLVEVAARHLGPEAVRVLGSYWVLGNIEETRQLVASAGLEVTGTRSRLGSATFDSVADCVATEIEATPLGQRIDEETSRRLVEDAEEALASFVTGAGIVELPIHGHLIVARKV